MAIEKSYFGKFDETEIFQYTMSNDNGMTVSIIDRGATIRSIVVPDKNGNMVDVALAYDKPESYKANSAYFGNAIGRYANRLEDASFELNGKVYNLGKNDGRNSLHGGGALGFDKKTWEVEAASEGHEPELKFSLFSPDGEGGYPGNLNVTISYKLTKDNGLVISYNGVSDADTVLNLTNHSYFNLGGHDSGRIDNQILQMNCSFFTPNTDECMPYGEIRPVNGTAFDFTTPRTFGDAFAQDDEQTKKFNGFDHNFVIDGRGYRLFATAQNPENGICMECFTDKPGVQLYSGCTLDCAEGKGGAHYGIHGAFCLETQYFPNSMKYAHFPSPVLKANAKYDFTTEYRFSVK